MLKRTEDAQAMELWREGVRTRLLVARETGSSQLTVFEQWCDPGCGAPPHEHAVEEVLRVLSGHADFQISGETAALKSGDYVVVPAGARHGFVNTGDDVLHTEAILAAPIFEALYLDSSTHQRRWNSHTRS